MRRLTVRFLVLIALVWAGWWYLATSSVQGRLNVWLEDRRAKGWQAEASNITRSGFPLSITTVIQNIILSNPDAQSSLRVPQITLSSPIYWPGHATVRLPAAPVLIVTPQGTLTVGFDAAQAALRLRPDTTLQLQTLGATGSNVTLNLEKGQFIKIAGVQADVQQGRTPETYELDLTATGLSLGEAFTGAMMLPTGWPVTFEPVVLDMAVTFDRPWDRRVAKGTRPQPRTVRIDAFSAGFAETGLTADGDFVVDAAGIPTGTLRLRVRKWQGLFDMAVASSTIPPEWAPTVERMLQSMSDIEDTLDLTITTQDGQMRMGFLPLGPAPRLLIR